MSHRVAIIDTHTGNLFSLQAALESIGKQVVLVERPEETDCDQLVLPGQGRFGRVMEALTQQGWIEFLNQWRADNKTLLGICVGMQVLFEGSAEDPQAKGLGWFSGQAERLAFPKQPMVGWAKVDSQWLLPGYAYFVNSFAIRESSYSIGNTCYGESFCCAVKSDHIVGVQFHPEKSSHYGKQLLQQILNEG